MVQAPKKYKEYFVSIDSIDRDRNVWPSPSQFEVKFGAASGFRGATLPAAFKNVLSIEVLGCSYPNTNSVLNEPCLYLCFDELRGSYEGTNATSIGAFAKLIPRAVFGDYVHSYSACALGRQRKIMFNPGTTIGKLTPTFRTSRGTVFDFGTDAPPDQQAIPNLQISITMKIVVGGSFAL